MYLSFPIFPDGPAMCHLPTKLQTNINGYLPIAGNTERQLEDVQTQGGGTRVYL